MKKNLLSTILIASVVMLGACKKDNHKELSSTVTGRVVYQGQPLNVRSNGVQLELWQHGYQLFSKIPVYVAQDGTFSAVVGDGDYKLVRLKGNGPWTDNTDSIDVHVSGTAAVDVPVQPYFIIANQSATYNKSDTSITATFKINKVVQSAAVESVSLSIGTTQIVDIVNNVVSNDANAPADISQAVTLKLSINPDRYPDLPNLNRAEIRRLLGTILYKKYGYIRVGVKTIGIAERIYTNVQKMDLN